RGLDIIRGHDATHDGLIVHNVAYLLPNQARAETTLLARRQLALLPEEVAKEVFPGVPFAKRAGRRRGGGATMAEPLRGGDIDDSGHSAPRDRGQRGQLARPARCGGGRWLTVL